MKYQEFREYYKKKNITDSKVASILHVSKGSYSLKLHGKRALTLDDVKILKDHFKLSAEQVIYFFVK